jgi:NAD(P)-dependent dehydrogenase (short-subunit alcohol dehydrogenase family)
MIAGRLGLEGRCALVTGGTSEAGEACVRRLREEGMILAFTGADRARGEAIALATGAAFLECDARDRSSCDRAFAQALELCGGGLDMLVTNADMLLEGSLQAISDAAFRELLEANLTSVLRAARACFGPMREQGGGSMVHVASDAGIRARHEMAAFSVASAGVIAVAELLAAEGAAYGIRSNAVCPAPGTDAASLVAWLASDESAHVSGATLRVDDAAGAAMVLDTRA